jgi:hypothetical protein
MCTSNVSLLIRLAEPCAALDRFDDGAEPLVNPVFNGLLPFRVQDEVLQPIRYSDILRGGTWMRAYKAMTDIMSHILVTNAKTF